MIGILHFGSVAFYGFASALLGFSLAREARRLPMVATIVVTAGLVLHGLALADYASYWEQLPLNGLGPSISTLAFLAAVGYLMAATLGHASTVGLILVPFVTLLTGVAALVGLSPANEAIDFRGGWFVLHVVFALIGLVGLMVAFAAGLMYLLQFRELKSKHFGAIFRFFPPLDTLDRLGWRGLLIGFPFLTISLILGWAWMANFGEPNALPVPKLIWVVLSWVASLAAILARVGGGRRSERGALVSVVGFLVVVVFFVILRAQGTPTGSFL